MHELGSEERIIIALDVSSRDEARRIVDELAGKVGAFKVGLQLFSAAGPEFVRELTSRGHKVFLDLKFHDIPNTVAMACKEAVRLGVWMLNVHAAGGREMMAAARGAVDECSREEGHGRPFVIAVTVLTSSTRETLVETGIEGSPEDSVTRLARLAHGCGLDGVVASAREASLIREAVQDETFVKVTPGIRAANATSDDQKRVTTLAEALAAGSSYAVVGRPITSRRDRAGALEELLNETVTNAQ